MVDEDSDSEGRSESGWGGREGVSVGGWAGLG